MLTRIALTIAGSDSSGGAGIQADIKTMSALGIYSCTVITAVTAQNTSYVNHVLPLDSDTIRKQIRSVISDIPIHAIKIGMVYNNEIITTISDDLKNLEIPIVLDPIIAAGTGSELLQEEFLSDFKIKLIPICDLITPNIKEAEKLSGIKINDEHDIKRTALQIQKFGAKNVVIKGGHFKNKDKVVVDVILDEFGNFNFIKNPRLKIVEIHGSGCNFSAAATSFLALKNSIVKSCIMANKYVHKSIMNIFKIGNGIPVNNPISNMYEESCKYRVIEELSDAVEQLTKIKNFQKLIPETQSNIVYAVPYAKSVKDVAGVEGRIVNVGDGVAPSSGIKFGTSKHVASAVLQYMKMNQLVRSAINIKNDEKILDKCQKLYNVSGYERESEPKGIKNNEGKSIFWGVKLALSKNQDANIIFHKGDIGKEPMIIIFGQNPQEVVDKIKKLLNNMKL